MSRVTSSPRWVPLVEIVVLVGARAALNVWLWANDLGFAGLAPHPMLFITFVMLARYGLKSGVLAAMICALEYAAMVAGPDQSLLLHRLLSPSLAAPLVELVPMTIFGGMLIQRQFERARAAAEATEEGARRVEQLTQELAELHDVNVQLGERIVPAHTTPAIVFSHVPALYALDVQQLNDNMLRVLAGLLRIRSAAVWWNGDGGLRRVASLGAPPLQPLALDRRLEERFVHDVLALHEIPPEQRPAGFPLLAGRIRSGDGGPIIGYLTIDQLSLRSSVDALRMFRMLVRWMSIASGNALTFRRLEARPTQLRVSR